MNTSQDDLLQRLYKKTLSDDRLYANEPEDFLHSPLAARMTDRQATLIKAESDWSLPNGE